LLEGQLIRDALDSDPFELTRASVPEEGGEETDAKDGEDDILEKKKNREIIDRVKGMLRVISCTRTALPDGYSSINCVVQLDDDGKMKDVEQFVRLHFNFLREPQHESGAGNDDEDDEVIYADAEDFFSSDGEGSGDDGNGERGAEDGKKEGMNGQPNKKRKRMTKDDAPADDNDNTNNDAASESGNDARTDRRDKRFAPKTIVTYKIDFSVDSGKMERLLGVDVYASGDRPSIEPAIPLIDENEEEEDDHTNGDGDNGERKERDEDNPERLPTGDAEFEEIEMSDPSEHGSSSGGNDDAENSTEDDPKDENRDGDRFGVFVSPENVVALIDRTNLNLNDRSVFYFLMTLPFYEHEWDIAGFLFSALFDDEDDDDDEEEEEDICLPCK